ncbi:MAG: hypothetical protein ACREDR_14470 [Blastocatellia bacterium]
MPGLIRISNPGLRIWANHFAGYLFAGYLGPQLYNGTRTYRYDQLLADVVILFSQNRSPPTSIQQNPALTDALMAAGI